MKQILNLNESTEIMTSKREALERGKSELPEFVDEFKVDFQMDIIRKNSIKMPIAELVTLGAGVSSLIPALRTVTQTTNVNTQGLFQLANAGVGDTLKIAKNGNFWGAFKNAEGGSKFAQLKSAEPLSVTSTSTMPIDPATMMMAVALYSIEKQLDNIVEMEKQILSFLEIEKESEIEADMEVLSDIISKYKFNWDNDHFVSSNHKMVLDIKRTARKNMIVYQKNVNDVLSSKQLVISQTQVSTTLKKLQKKFKYYRLSLYIYSMASLIEVMLSGNFKEENISGSKSEIESLTFDYRNIYSKCSVQIEKMSKKSWEANVLKGIGSASGTVGKIIGSIPLVKEGAVDEFLLDSEIQLKKNAKGRELNVLQEFAEMSNPGTGVFVDKMNDMIQIYNHTTEICFDEKEIYLVNG